MTTDEDETSQFSYYDDSDDDPTMHSSMADASGHVCHPHYCGIVVIDGRGHHVHSTTPMFAPLSGLKQTMSSFTSMSTMTGFELSGLQTQASFVFQTTPLLGYGEDSQYAVCSNPAAPATVA